MELLKPLQNIVFEARFDGDADVWVAQSDADAITAEAATKEELLRRLKTIVPDLLESRNQRHEGRKLVIDWVTVEHTEVAIA